MLLNPIDIFAQRIVAGIRAGDHLQTEQSILLQQLIAFGKISLQVSITDRFEHFDRNDLVELTRNQPIIH